MARETASVRIRVLGGIRAAKEAKTVEDAIEDLGNEVGALERHAAMAVFSVAALKRQISRLGRASTITASAVWTLNTSLLALKVAAIGVGSVVLPALGIALWNVVAAAGVWTTALVGGMLAIGAAGGLMVAGIIGRFGEMKEVAGSAAAELAGAASTLKSTFLEVTATGADAWMRGLASAMERITPLLRTLEPSFTALGETLGKVADTFGRQVAGMGPELKAMFAAAIPALEAAGEFAASFFGFMVSIATVGAPLAASALQSLAAWFDGLGASLTPERLEAAQATLRGFADGVKKFFGAIAEPLDGVLGPALDRFGGQWEPLAVAAGGAIGEILAGLVKFGSSIMPGVTKALSAIGKVAPKIFDGIGKAITTVRSIFEPMAPFIANVLWPIIKGIGKGIGDTFKVVGAIIAVVAKVLGWIGEKARPLKGFFEGFGRVIGWIFGGPIIKGIGTFIGAFGRIGAVVGPPLRTVGSLLGSIGNKIGTVGKAVAGLIGKFADTVSKVLATVGDWTNAGLKLGKSVIDGIIQGVRDGATAVEEAIIDIIPGASNARQLDTGRHQENLGEGGGGFWGTVGGLLGIGGDADGGVITRSGYRWVGEKGPELWKPPVGTTILPAGESRRLAASDRVDPSGGTDLIAHINLNLDGQTVWRSQQRITADRQARTS